MPLLLITPPSDLEADPLLTSLARLLRFHVHPLLHAVLFGFAPGLGEYMGGAGVYAVWAVL